LDMKSVGAQTFSGRLQGALCAKEVRCFDSGKHSECIYIRVKNQLLGVP